MAFKQHIMTVFGCIALMTFGLSSIGSRASAEALTFDNQGNHRGGTFTWDSTSARLSNGVIDRVSDAQTAAVTGACGAGFGCLSFKTGSRLAVFESAAQELSIYGEGGFLSITGMVPVAGAAGLLYTTNFGFIGSVSLQVNKLTSARGDRLISISGSLGGGVLDSNLASYFGVSTVAQNGTDAHTAIVLTFNDRGNSGSGAGQTNSVLVTADNAVPEPTSMALLGTSLAGIAFLGRKRVRKSSQLHAR